MSAAYNLYKRYTMAELIKMARTVCDDPKNQNPLHATGKSIWLYKKSALLKLDAIAMAITWHVADNRPADDKPISQ